MLIITVQEGERVHVGDAVLRVTGSRSGARKFRLAIEAPREVPVVRETAKRQRPA